MANMSYCRFRNTLKDLLDCEEALENLDPDFNELSCEEERAAKKLIEVCKRIVDNF